jgi:hypothetical protein
MDIDGAGAAAAGGVRSETRKKIIIKKKVVRHTISLLAKGDVTKPRPDCLALVLCNPSLGQAWDDRHASK